MLNSLTFTKVIHDLDIEMDIYVNKIYHRLDYREE